MENSFFARIARVVLKTKRVAMVLGETIHLSGVDRDTFLRNEEWVAHELCHIRQFKEHGYYRFLGLYLWESVKRGYYNNKFEVEARVAGAQRIFPPDMPDILKPPGLAQAGEQQV
ncbi:hypothetical protein [Botryobacter ruber]|uniref:hypothetical protein n=1 Tax=Botryobacter ruber TaxID=2171629 RepID=UPI001F0C5823|nr:hypothetical protein [Botryobacter ruber]